MVRLGARADGNNLAKLELDTIVGYAGDPAAADALTGCDIEFLAHASAEHLR